MNIIGLIGSYVLVTIYLFTLIFLFLIGVCLIVAGIKGIIKLIKEKDQYIII